MYALDIFSCFIVLNLWQQSLQKYLVLNQAIIYDFGLLPFIPKNVLKGLTGHHLTFTVYNYFMI